MHRLIPRLLGWSLIWIVAVDAWASTERESREFDFGPIISRQRDVHGNLRLRALGPIFERAEAADGQRLTAVRPAYSRYVNPGLEQARSDYVWPVGYSKAFRDERSGRVLLAYWTRFDINDPQSRYRFWIIPVYFQGRDVHGQNYAAVFPLGGRIHEFLGRDEIEFLAFPLYAKTTLKEVDSYSFLWPLIGHTDGRGIYRFRVFPFYAQNRHRDRYNKKSVMWPIWTSAEYFYPGSSGSGFILFPFYGQLRLDDQRSWMVLPPFFRVSQGDRVNFVLAPWPLFQRRTGEVQQTWLWPFWGRKSMRGVQSGFFLWPIVTYSRIDRGDMIYSQRFVLPFYYSDQMRRRLPDEPIMDLDAPVPRGTLVNNYQKLWPLISYRREGDESRFRMLDLSPLKDSAPIERNYAPLWTLFEKVRVGGKSDTELLWGLYRRQRRGPEETYTSIFPVINWARTETEDESYRRWSILKGLIGYERQGTNRRYRLLYVFNWGDDKQESQP